ncbi:MAG: dihydroorotate dehydrogenase electron transfer subunit [Ignavibacteriales bacterium]|nr:dihydroorotate dehydrogenase electron transfer subunit [Ignavibacteriales bacterium]
MIIENSIVESNERINSNVYLLKVTSPEIASQIGVGQFCNIKVSDTDYPLLRRPLSICDVEDDKLFFLYQVVGVGTEILSRKMKGDRLNILGPLGNGFNIQDDFETAIIVAGGIGIAPFPFLIKKIMNKNIITYVGFKTKADIIDYGLKNCKYSTDDGSLDFKGTCVDLLKSEGKTLNSKCKIFACGPNSMLRNLKEFCSDKNITCEVSLESVMACGFGICQGCAVESKNDDNYKLVCKDGPVFNINEIKI